MKPQSDPRRHLPLAPHLFQILLSLPDRDLHGYGVLKDIRERTGGEMALGTSTLYAALHRLVEEGFLEETSPAAASSDAAQGPPRKVFRVTEAGRTLAREEARRIQRLHRMVEESPVFESLREAGSLGEGS
jgi:DNA-binding PadR family transcriptional regulator